MSSKNLIGYEFAGADGRYIFDTQMWIDDLEAAINAPRRRVPFMLQPPFVIGTRESPEAIFSLLNEPRQGCPMLFSAQARQTGGAGFVCMADVDKLALVFEFDLFDYHPALEEMLCMYRIRNADVRKVSSNIETFLSQNWPVEASLGTPERIFCIRDERDTPLGFSLDQKASTLPSSIRKTRA